MPLARSVSFRILKCPSLCCLQNVSVPRSVGFFPCQCPDEYLPPLSPGSERSSLGQFVSCVLTSPLLCRLQEVSAPRSVGFFPCPEKSLPLLSPECECPSLARFGFRVMTSPSLCPLQDVSAPRSRWLLSVSRQVPPSAVSRM